MKKTLSPLQLDTLRDRIQTRQEKEGLSIVAAEILRMYKEFIKEKDNLIEFLKRQKGPKGDALRFEDLSATQLRLLKARIDDDFLQEVVRQVSSSIPPPKDGHTPVLGKDFMTPDDVRKIARLASELVEVKEPDHIDVDGIISSIEQKLMDKKKTLSISDIEGLKEVIEDIRRRPTGYVHGGGDTVKAGTNVIITIDNDGNRVISALGGTSGANVVTEYALTAIQSGSNVTIDLSQLSHFATFVNLIQLSRNNVPQTQGASYNFTISGSVITVFNADAGEIFNITYAYTS